MCCDYDEDRMFIYLVYYPTLFLHTQVQLQNLMTSKYIEHFLEEVSLWQNKLSVADQVITLW